MSIALVTAILADASNAMLSATFSAKVLTCRSVAACDLELRLLSDETKVHLEQQEVPLQPLEKADQLSLARLPSVPPAQARSFTKTKFSADTWLS